MLLFNLLFGWEHTMDNSSKKKMMYQNDTNKKKGS